MRRFHFVLVCSSYRLFLTLLGECPLPSLATDVLLLDPVVEFLAVLHELVHLQLVSEPLHLVQRPLAVLAATPLHALGHLAHLSKERGKGK